MTNSDLQGELGHFWQCLEVAEKKATSLEEQNVVSNTTRDEAVAQQLVLKEELAYIKFDNFKKHVIDEGPKDQPPRNLAPSKG